MQRQDESILDTGVAARLDSRPMCPDGRCLDGRGMSGGSRVPPAGCLIVNADDWGRDRNTTDRIGECCIRGSVSSVSAMVFMEDSERAATLALERGIDAGLHLNFTTAFSSRSCPPSLARHQQDVAKRLLRHRLAQVLFYPGLMSSFEYVVAAQIEEYCRLYGAGPERLDGHHHMHLCANVLWGKLLPAGTVVRRNTRLNSSH